MMKLSMFSKQTQKGFTLVELLIVIALIGALVVGVLVALDPVDQIKKGQDVGAQNFAKEYVNAQQRFFTSSQSYAGADTGAVLMNSATGQAITLALKNGGEVKSSYKSTADGTTGGRVYITHNTTSGLLEAYYLLQSKAFLSNTTLDRCVFTAPSTFACGASTAQCTAENAVCYARISGSN